MTFNRREFLRLSFKTAVVIGAGNTLQSFAASNFILPEKEKIKLRFAIASDGHYGQPDTKYDDMHDEMVAWLNREKKNRGVDFTMINGDLFHNDTAMLPEVKKKWDDLTMPYYVSHGNHDMIDEENWNKMWNTKWHYTFEQPDVGFIVLNSADDEGKYICPDLDFAKDQLEKYKSKEHLFVFMHITPFNWTKAGLPCPELVEMFNKQKNLKATFHGHDHDQDNVKQNEGKYYFFDSHVAGSWGTGYRGYRIVEVLKSGEIITYQMNPATQEKVNTNTV